MDAFKRLRDVLETAKTDEKGRLRLPSERDLSELLSMQRTLVREQLATLENLGFVQRVRGSGTFLQMPQPAFVQIYFDIALRLGFISVDALEAAREMLEREIAYCAAHNATDADIAKLEEYLVEMGNPNVHESLAADYDFHRHLAYMTRNPVIILIIQGLASVLKEVVHRRRVLVRQSRQSMSKTNDTHQAVIDALKNRDPDAAKDAMNIHFRIWDEESKGLLEWIKE
ncbi:FadR family transcriptional regulator (plasmid) [Photobacterium sp. GJ3]|uniref:FadR/GntR family transcriptional regulator n=1 Tax=Photobacterium sp. GJ3 TaxID=2829502 RepID=UPI001B8B95B0|nr:FCD domain-containing protein [Photobacterium sp. GJ3]QUJ69694.1 FadR family transcriptional regulator [Photobacterium sp. GJ3]